MIIPIHMPAWMKIIKNARAQGLDITINVDMFKGKHTGHFFYKDKSYIFRLELYPKNMILSMKEFNKELLETLSKSFEFPYRIVYETNSEFPIHAEWYFFCTEEEILREIDRLRKTPNIKILSKKLRF